MSSTATFKLNLSQIRTQFPILNQLVHQKPLIYFDNAASSQTVNTVLNSLHTFYQRDHANIHRGVHTLAERSTKSFESTRLCISKYINAHTSKEIIFTKGTTESINLVAHSLGEKYLQKGDEILLSQMEHHSNIVPWQIIAQKTGAIIKVIPINFSGDILMEEYANMLGPKTKVVAVTWVSNTLGTINPVEEICHLAKQYGAYTLIDAAQAVSCLKIDVQALSCDFLVFSGHKMYGPTGVGMLYGKSHILDDMPPYQAGGDMIEQVAFSNTTYNSIPHKFEAGTPNIGGVIAWKAAFEFIESIGLENIKNRQDQLLQYALSKISNIQGFKPIGTAKQKGSILSFLIDKIHPYDLGQLLDIRGIAVRTGHHCTQPLMDFYKIEGTVRASFAIYNTFEEIDIFITYLKQSIDKLRA